MRFILKLSIAVLNLIFAVMKLFPVQDKVTFISRQSNDKSDDMKLLEAELKRQAPDITVTFLCRKLEGNIFHKMIYCFHVFRQMYHIVTSRVVVLDSYCAAVSVLKQRKSLTVIQMWHALGALKRFGLSIVGEGEGRSLDLAECMSMHKNYTYVLTSSEKCLPYFAEAFGYEKEYMRVMSLPRVDYLTDEEFSRKTKSRIYAKYPMLKDKKTIVYAPTFRKGKDISSQIDALAAEFDCNTYEFVVKKHPLMEVSCNQCLVDEEFSTMEMLMAADFVICDYSAVIFEAAILKKPLFFYAFDYDEYGVARNFYIDYMNEMPGVISKEPSEIAEAIKTGQWKLECVEDFSRKYVKNQRDCTKALAEMIAEECLRKGTEK